MAANVFPPNENWEKSWQALHLVEELFDHGYLHTPGDSFVLDRLRQVEAVAGRQLHDASGFPCEAFIGPAETNLTQQLTGKGELWQGELALSLVHKLFDLGLLGDPADNDVLERVQRAVRDTHALRLRPGSGELKKRSPGPWAPVFLGRSYVSAAYGSAVAVHAGQVLVLPHGLRSWDPERIHADIEIAGQALEPTEVGVEQVIEMVRNSNLTPQQAIRSVFAILGVSPGVLELVQHHFGWSMGPILDLAYRFLGG